MSAAENLKRHGFSPIDPQSFGEWVESLPQEEKTMTFEKWMQELDEATFDLSGVSVHDLTDQPFRDMFDSGVTPDEAAETILGDESFPFDLYQ